MPAARPATGSFEELDPRLFSFNSPHGWCGGCRGHGKVPKRRQHLDISRYDSVLAAEMEADRSIDRMDDTELVECPACEGSRINPVGSSVRLKNTPVAALSHLSINESADHFSKLKFTAAREKLISRDIIPEITQRLSFLQEVGLGYLHLNRSGNTLSGGESQRIRLAAQLGSNLRGVLYVLDEPTIGLHPRDNAALLKTLTALRNQGNSLIIVEHDEDTIFAADHLIDLGPVPAASAGKSSTKASRPRIRKSHPPKRKSSSTPPPTAPSPTRWCTPAVGKGAPSENPIRSLKSKAAMRTTSRTSTSKYPWVASPSSPEFPAPGNPPSSIRLLHQQRRWEESKRSPV